jgi:hypothetical protein
MHKNFAKRPLTTHDVQMVSHHVGDVGRGQVIGDFGGQNQISSQLEIKGRTEEFEVGSTKCGPRLF